MVSEKEKESVWVLRATLLFFFVSLGDFHPYIDFSVRLNDLIKRQEGGQMNGMTHL